MKTFDNNPNKSVGNLDWLTFHDWFIYYANTFMRQQGNYKGFIEDDNNKDIIRNLFYWTIRNPHGAYDINKGKIQTIHGGWQGGRSLFPDYPQSGSPSVEY